MRAVALLALLLVAAVEGCRLNQVRGCGQCPSMATTTKVKSALVIPMEVFHPESVVAATFTDIIRLPASYLLLLEMPGVADVDVRVDAASCMLSVQGFVRDKPAYRAFRGPPIKLFARKFILPAHVDPEGVRHELRDGLLRLWLPHHADAQAPLKLKSGSEDIDVRGPPSEPELVRGATLCKISRVEEKVKAEALLGSNLPGGACAEVKPCGARLEPLADIVAEEGLYEAVLEMPGVAQDGALEVEVQCWPGVHQPDHPRKRGTPGCILSAAGSTSVENDEEVVRGELVRQERGVAGPKEFATSLYFHPGRITSRNMTYELSNGLLRVKLMRPPPPPPPGLWLRLLNRIVPSSGLPRQIVD